MKTCTSCGKEAEDEFVFCIHCETKFPVQDGVPVADLLGYLNELNQEPIAGGLTAKGIVKLKELTKEDYVAVRANYKKWHNVPRSEIFWLLLTGVCVAAYFFWRHELWVLLIAVYPLGRLIHKIGRYDGFVEGHVNGFESGINRALHLTDEDSIKIHDMAIHHEIDEVALNAVRGKHRKREDPR